MNSVNKFLTKVLLVDNYDSFTYNLKHLLEINGADVSVIKNDEVKIETIKNFDRIVFSPGPGLPAEAGKMNEIIEKFYKSKPMLGVCLGHQAIGSFYGGKLLNLNNIYHGVESEIIHYNDNLFCNIDNCFIAGRYHSWIISNSDFPEELEILAVDKEQNIMALKHKIFPSYGIQFHPESIMTPAGSEIIYNWLSLEL